jgi:ribosome-binding factor A
MSRSRSQGRSTARAPSQRQLRVGEIVRHAVVQMLQRGEVQDPVLERVAVTIPEVRMTPDLRRAIVFVTPLGGGDATPVLDALGRHRRFMRGALAGRVELKFVPELEFAYDARFEKAERIDELLRSPEVARDLKDGN